MQWEFRESARESIRESWSGFPPPFSSLFVLPFSFQQQGAGDPRMPYMYVLYVRLTCMPYMYALYMYAAGVARRRRFGPLSSRNSPNPHVHHRRPRVRKHRACRRQRSAHKAVVTVLRVTLNAPLAIIAAARLHRPPLSAEPLSKPPSCSCFGVARAKGGDRVVVVVVVGEGGGGGGGEGGGRFIQSYRSELRGGLRARPRYPGIGDGTHRTTIPRATHPYLFRRRRSRKVYSRANAVKLG